MPGSPVPAVDPAWLAATADRERAVGVLRAGFAEGRLTQDELHDRVARAYAARTYGELWALTADLPTGAVPVPHGPFNGLSFMQAPGAFDADAQSVPSPWRSGAALVITALVIFALAALVTAIVTAHTQTVIYGGGFQAPAPAQVVPNVTNLEPPTQPLIQAPSPLNSR